MKRCPYCAEDIQDQAVKCKYCHEMLDGTRTWSTSSQLVRSRSDRMLAGVCGGFAKSYDMDPTIVRLLAVLLVLATAVVPIVIVYAIMAVVLPEGD